MPSILSKLFGNIGDWSFKYNCYEAVHPWTPFCSDCALDIGATVFTEAIKLYTPLYLFTQLSQQRSDLESFKRTAQSIIRSTSFISANAFFALFFFCSTKHLTGKFYYYAVAYMPAFLASAMAVLIEKPHRRSSLAFYVANVASEALFRLWVARGIIKPISKGQVYLFTLAIATMMYLSKKNGFDDDALSSILKLVIGSEEANQMRIKRRTGSEIKSACQEENDLQLLVRNDEDSFTTRTKKQIHDASSMDGDECDEKSCQHSKRLVRSGSFETERHLIFFDSKNSFDDTKELISHEDQAQPPKFSPYKFITTKHPLCPHSGPWSSSCLLYALQASLKAFAIGYIAQTAMRVVSKLPALRQDPKMALRTILADPSPLRLASFLASFSGLFKLFSCAIRWHRNKWTPENNFLAALLAGPTLLFYPSPTVALYVLWKALEALLAEAERTGKVRTQTKDSIVVLIYGLATSQLFYSALMNPKYMKKSYMSFLDRMSRHRLHMVNRSVLDVFGTQASAGYEEFFPDLHPRFMSNAFMGSIWIWMIEQKFPFTPVAIGLIGDETM